MSEPHALFTWGPIGFVAVSSVVSVLLRPWVQRTTRRLQERAFDRRLAHLGRPIRELDAAIGRRVSVVGVIEVEGDDPTGLAFEQGDDAEHARAVAEQPTLAVDGRSLVLYGELSLIAGSDEVTIGETRFKRLYRGDRVHVSGKLARAGATAEGDAADALALVSEPLAPVQLVEANLPPERRPFVARSMSLLLTIGVLWGVSTFVALLLCELPPAPDGPLPATHVDAALVAHAVPPVSIRAARRMADRAEARAPAGWGARAELEDALVLAARIDPEPDRAVERFVRHQLRTRAGWFAARHPSAKSCPLGLEALAEAGRGGQLQELMSACSHVPGDAAGHAAFKMGDFMNAVGPEAESIISRVTLPPRDEPDCVAGGYDVPPVTLPLCRLEHAEQVKAARAIVYEELRDAELPRYGRAWAAAGRAERGAPLDASALPEIDPALLVDRPLAALADEPLALLFDLREAALANLTPAQAARLDLVLAAERSMTGRDEDARFLLEEGLGYLDRAEAQRETLDAEQAASALERRRQALALAAAIAIRSLDADRIRAATARLTPGRTPDDALIALADRALARPGAETLTLARVAAWADAPPTPPELWGLDEPSRALARDWVREGWPACDGCRFHRQLDHLTRKLDAARALGDAELVETLEPVVRRFEAVLTNRPLALSLRGADPDWAAD